jgi:ABC-type transport system involved in multi-copper enzyme maturation permease subunit
MNNVLKSIRLDYYTVKVSYKIFVFAVYTLAIFLGVLTQPGLIIAIVMIFSAFISGSVFSIYEKNNLSKLFGILPLERFEVVIGRYLYALFFGVINGIISGSIAYIISLYTNKGFDHLAFIAYLSFSFLYFCLAVGIIFPTFFKFGFSKAFIFALLPLYIIFISPILMVRNTAALNKLQQIIQYFASHPNMIWVTGIGVGIILLVISCLLSCLIYQKKEL